MRADRWEFTTRFEPSQTFYLAVGYGADDRDWLMPMLDEMRENLLRPGTCFRSAAVVHADANGRPVWATASRSGLTVDLASPMASADLEVAIEGALEEARPGVVGAFASVIAQDGLDSLQRDTHVLVRTTEPGQHLDDVGLGFELRTVTGCTLPDGTTVPPAYIEDSIGFFPREICSALWPMLHGLTSGSVKLDPDTCSRLQGTGDERAKWVHATVDGESVRTTMDATGCTVLIGSQECLGQIIRLEGGPECPE